MNERIRSVEEAIALLRVRPEAARDFLRPTVEQIVAQALAKGYTIGGET